MGGQVGKTKQNYEICGTPETVMCFGCWSSLPRRGKLSGRERMNERAAGVMAEAHGQQTTPPKKKSWEEAGKSQMSSQLSAFAKV